MNRISEYIVGHDYMKGREIIIQTRAPYLVAMPYKIPKKDIDKLEELMANDKKTIVKVKGFTIFLTPYDTLTGKRVDKKEIVSILEGMEQVYREHYLPHQKHPNRKYQEGVADDMDERFSKMMQIERRKQRKMV